MLARQKSAAVPRAQRAAGPDLGLTLTANHRRAFRRRRQQNDWGGPNSGRIGVTPIDGHQPTATHWIVRIAVRLKWPILGLDERAYMCEDGSAGGEILRRLSCRLPPLEAARPGDALSQSECDCPPLESGCVSYTQRRPGVSKHEPPRRSPGSGKTRVLLSKKHRRARWVEDVPHTSSSSLSRAL